MSTATITHFVFVDFENVPNVDLDILKDHSVVVLIFLGLKSKLKAGLVEQMTKLPCEVRLIKVGLTKGNALDFVLVYHLGETMARHPGGRYYIVAKDTDYEAIIRYLGNNGVAVTQCDSFSSLPFVSPPEVVATLKNIGAPAKTVPPAEKTPADRFVKLVARLKNNLAPRPKKKTSLLAHINTAYGQKLNDAEKTQKLAELISHEVLVIEAKDKVRYL